MRKMGFPSKLATFNYTTNCMLLPYCNVTTKLTHFFLNLRLRCLWLNLIILINPSLIPMPQNHHRTPLYLLLLGSRLLLLLFWLLLWIIHFVLLGIWILPHSFSLILDFLLIHLSFKRLLLSLGVLLYSSILDSCACQFSLTSDSFILFFSSLDSSVSNSSSLTFDSSFTPQPSSLCSSLYFLVSDPSPVSEFLL